MLLRPGLTAATGAACLTGVANAICMSASSSSCARPESLNRGVRVRANELARVVGIGVRRVGTRAGAVADERARGRAEPTVVEAVFFRVLDV